MPSLRMVCHRFLQDRRLCVMITHAYGPPQLAIGLLNGRHPAPSPERPLGLCFVDIPLKDLPVFGNSKRDKIKSSEAVAALDLTEASLSLPTGGGRIGMVVGPARLLNVRKESRLV